MGRRTPGQYLIEQAGAVGQKGVRVGRGAMQSMWMSTGGLRRSGKWEGLYGTRRLQGAY